MNITVNYELRLSNNNVINGSIKTKIGLPIDDFKINVLEKQGFKNHACFACSDNNVSKVIVGMSTYTFIERSTNKKSPKTLEKAPRKLSSDVLFEQSSMEFQDQNQQFIVVQPQKPPLVRGTLRKVNRFFCCMSSETFFQIRINTLNIYSNSRFQRVQKSIMFKDIHKIRSYRKKDRFFLSLQLNGELLEYSFTNSNLCKQWMGYLMQAMEFTKYLCNKQDFSRADSFRKYMQTLRPDQNQQFVLLNQENTNLETVHNSEPTEKQIQSSIRKLTKFKEFQVEYKIGSGSFSIVYLARRKGKSYALKQLSKDALLNKNQMKYAFTQLRTLIKCRQCKYVIPLYFAFQTMDYLYLALQYAPSGDLAQQILAKGRLSNSQALTILAQLVFAIQFIHKQKIIYRDLKPDNIMLSQQGHVLLVDFGLAKELSNENDYADSFLGTPLYLAPQRFQGIGAVNFKSDVYGVGCIFYEMLHGESPFRGSNYQSLASKIKNDAPDFRSDLPPQYLSFLHSTLQKDPDRRLSTMSKHSIFNSINWKDIQLCRHEGIRLEDTALTHSVQINYEIDQDYNEETYPSRLINQWEYKFQE